MVVLMTSMHKILGTWKRRVDRYITLSEFQRSKILNSSLRLHPDQIVVKPNFVFNGGREELRERGDYYLYIGRLEKDKGVGTLLSCFLELEYNLRIIGDGPMREKVKEICSTRKNIEYLGSRDNQFVLQILKTARGLIFPSHYYEGFPMVIAEAFSCGTPVISSDIGSHAEIVINGFNGLHFRVDDPDDLSLKVRTLAEMKDESMNKNALDSSTNLYNEKKNYKLLMKIYEDLIEKKEVV